MNPHWAKGKAPTRHTDDATPLMLVGPAKIRGNRASAPRARTGSLGMILLRPQPDNPNARDQPKIRAAIGAAMLLVAPTTAHCFATPRVYASPDDSD